MVLPASETFRAKKKGETESKGESPDISVLRTLCTNHTRVQDCSGDFLFPRRASVFNLLAQR